MSIDWTSEVRSIVDLGSESYERKLTRIILKGGAVALFVVFVGILAFKR